MLQYLKVFNNPQSSTDPRLVSMFTHLFRILLSHISDSLAEQTRNFFHSKGAMNIFVDSIVRLTTKNCGDAEESTLSNAFLCCAGLGQFGMLEKQDFLSCNGVRVLTRVVRQMLYHSASERHMNPV